MSLWGGRPFQMSGSCREALSDVREALPIVREWLGDLPGFPLVLGVPPGCPGVVGMPSWMTGSGRNALPDD